jgi:hypothetical protein
MMVCVCLLGCYPQIIALFAFAVKHFTKSDTLAGFTTSVALIWYIECVTS